MSTTARLGLASAVALVVANMIGAGVFTTAGFSLASVGTRGAVLWLWLAGGVIAMCGALSYGALALRYPRSGGEYEYLWHTWHPAAGIAAGLVSMLAGFSAPIASSAAALEAYLYPLFGALPPARPWLGSAAIVLLAASHGVRVAAGARLQNAMVGVKLVLIVVFLVIGARLLARPATGPSLAVEFTWAAFATSSLYVYFAYSGWNASAYVAGEVRAARTNVPRAMLLGTALVLCLYVGLNAVFLWAVPPASLAGRADVGAIAAEALLGASGRPLVSSIVALALLTSISAMLMAGPRVYARMAEDGVLPRLFAATGGGGAPFGSVALQAGLALVFLWVADLQQLMGYIGWTLSLSAAATVLGLIRVRRRDGAAAVPCVGWPLVPLLFVLPVCGFAGLSLFDAPGKSLLGLGTLGLAVVVAWSWTRRKGAADAKH